MHCHVRVLFCFVLSYRFSYLLCGCAGAVELRNEIGRRLGCTLPGTLVFDYPTTSAIAAFIYEATAPEEEAQAAHTSPHVAASSLVPSPATQACIGITDTAVRLPSSAQCGEDAICVVPLDRWDADAPSQRAKRWESGRFGGFVSSWAMFDSEAFGIPPSEAMFMDPQQRCLLEEAGHLITSADSGAKVAVAVGIAKLGEPQLVAAGGAAGVAAGSSLVSTGRALSAAAGRLSFAFGLTGPCVAIDTACSSSLVGLGYVRDSMSAFGCPSGLAAGVNLPMNWETSSMFAAAGMMAPDGRCKALDSMGDGYVRSEACIVIRMDVVRAGSLRGARALLTAVAVNQDGRSSSLTAPHGPSQQAVILSALQMSAKEPAAVHSFEMHGTGTALGDPIEVGALASVCKGRHTQAAALAAAKSRFGHSETGAGLLGLINTVRSSGSDARLPIMHLCTINAYVASALDGAQRSFSAVRQAAPGPLSTNACAALSGVSAFAFQGTNAHGVLEKSYHLDEESTNEHSKQLTRPIYYWYAPAPHAMLASAAISQLGGSSLRLEIAARTAKPSLAYLAEHVVHGRSILPAAAMLDLVLAAALHFCDGDGLFLDSLAIASPFQLERTEVHASVALDVSGGRGALLTFASHRLGGKPTVHSQASVAQRAVQRYARDSKKLQTIATLNNIFTHVFYHSMQGCC